MTNEELRKYYFGAYFFEETEDGYLQAFQYSKAQMEYFRGAFDFWYDRCMATTAKTIEFTTAATEVSFDYRFAWRGSEDSFELWIDGLAAEIAYVKDLPDEGNIAWTLPEGTKNAVIYLPADATVLVKNFTVNGDIAPAAKGKKVLWLGDSITQGYGPLRSAHTYVSVANRLLNYDIINQGIGGYIYDKKSLMKMEGYQPDKIIVALGTNQYGMKDMTMVEEYYETLTGIYGTEIPILVISPIWRGDRPEEYDVFLHFCDEVKRIAGSYPNVRVIDGLTLVPHLSEYYRDNLHPNCLGAEVYGRNLVEAIRNSGFDA
ncbi:MAG: SGNH/GDSL hydrolase family protein [Oscillospiraceae bacterium]|nr:SGNH/GDSL hydrolase family protein [Oscillospiraceae bacterium]